jgi:disulfide bond formation protein DsbB
VTPSMPRRPIAVAATICIALPEVLLTAVLTMQETLGIVPCELCLKQRSALYVALGLGVIGWMMADARRRAMAMAFSAGAIITSGAIALHQLGAERKWWKLVEACASPGGGTSLDSIMRLPMVRCDVPQWQRFGLTLADLNAIACLTAGAVAICLIAMDARNRNTGGSAIDPLNGKRH